MQTGAQNKKYDASVLSMFKTITTMTVENRDLLLKEMEKFARKIQSRAKRETCNIDIEFVTSTGSYRAVVKNISTTGAFIACRVPVLINEKIFIHFGMGVHGDNVMLRARTVHSAADGFGVEFVGFGYQDNQFLRSCVCKLPASAMQGAC